MVDPVFESTGANYAKRDESADRLWLAQRTRVNARNARQSNEQGGDRRNDEQPGKPSGTSAGPMISQKDTLTLESIQEETFQNPFESLLEAAQDGRLNQL